MICKNCGSELPNTAKFCKNCGKNPSAEPVVQQAVVTQSQQNVQTTQQQPTAPDFFEKANILGYFKNPFKASYQAYNGGQSEFSIFVFIVKCLILPISLFVLTDQLKSKCDVVFGTIEDSSREITYSASQVLLYSLLAVGGVLVAKWLINFLFAKMFGMKNLSLKNSFNLTCTTSAWSVISVLVAGIYLMRMPEKIESANGFFASPQDDFVYLVIFLFIAEFVFHNILLFTTYLAANPDKKPEHIALSLVLSETIYIFAIFVISSIIIPEVLYQDFVTYVLAYVVSNFITW